MSPVDFKKWPCRPVEFKGQGPPSAMLAVETRQVIIVLSWTERSIDRTPLLESD